LSHPEIDLNEVSVPLHPEELFGAPAPVHVEIGSGKGRFLLEMATRNPQAGFLGVERSLKYHKMVCDKVARRGIPNVRLVQTTAEDLLFRLLRPASIDAIYVLFPDPWPKKRHHKRRFVTVETTAAMVRALVTGGHLRIKSDHRGYAEVIENVLAQTRGLEPVPLAEAFEGLPRSGFECKYQEQGRTIFAFAFRKTGGPEEHFLSPKPDLVPTPR